MPAQRSKSASDPATIAKNFDSSCTLLTTQLKNQNPLEPLDTNQFTQQLVQFAQVEQQMKMNTQMASLIAIAADGAVDRRAGFLGSTVDGRRRHREARERRRQLELLVRQAATATITIKNATGATGLHGQLSRSTPGQQNFNWDGSGNNGTE